MSAFPNVILPVIIKVEKFTSLLKHAMSENKVKVKPIIYAYKL